MALCNPLPLSVNWLKRPAFNKETTAKVTGMSPLRLCYETVTFAHSFLLALSDGNQRPGYELPFKEACMAGN